MTKAITVDYANTLLGEVCADLAAKAGVPITHIGVFANKRVTYTADQAAVGKVLDDIARQIGSKIYERSGGFRFRGPN